MSENTFTRRKALGGFGALIAGTALAKGQGTGAKPDAKGNPPVALAPRTELVDAPEFEEMAKRELSAMVFATIAGTDHRAFDRITLRPRLITPTLNMDLSVNLFGDKLFTPIMVGPMSDQKQFHPDGEIATVQGAAAAKALTVVSSQSSVPIEKIAAQATEPLWYEVYANRDAKNHVEQAVKAGVKAICITVGALPGSNGKAKAGRTDWGMVDQIREGVSVPVLIKGIMAPEDVKLAMQHGAQGIVVSDYGGGLDTGKSTPIERLSSTVDAVAGKVPVLLDDGNLRRGTDVFKALALGAQGVMLGSPAMWGLAAYGASGVQSVVQLLQSELARAMGMSGRLNLQALDRSAVKIHTR